MQAILLGGQCSSRAMLENLADLEVVVLNTSDLDVNIVREFAMGIEGAHQ
jgi:hypothetical protein